MKLNGADLFVLDTGGNGAPIVFAHGLLWSSRMFAPQIAALRGQYRCIAFDFRGQGQSEVTASGYDMDTLADDAAALIEGLRIAPVHFVGLSMGGFVGMRLAARRPELVRSLALLETAPDPEPRSNLPKYLALTWAASLLGFKALAGQAMKPLFGRTFLRDPARAARRAELRQELVANDRVGAVRALKGVFGRKGVEDELGRIRAPTLVVTGDEDISVPVARAMRAVERIAGARFVGIPRAGHTSTLEEPEAVTAALREFIGSVR